MAKHKNISPGAAIVYSTVNLDGTQYAILRADVLHDVCQRAAVQARPRDAGACAGAFEPLDGSLDHVSLARRLLARRKRTGLTQADLARRAGIRVETLNRIERGRTTPDFATVRKLVVAMNAVERTVEQESASVDNRHA